MEFKDKFIAFLDILGFRELTKATESGSGMPISDLVDLPMLLGTVKDREEFERYGITVCPESMTLSPNIDFQITQVSDCAVISVEVSPGAVINLLEHCWKAIYRLMKKGIMVRGYVSRGLICYTETKLVGSGYNDACAKEKNVTVFKQDADEKGTHFVEIDNLVVSYIEGLDDDCVKTIFKRFVESDGELVAMYPFKRLSHSFLNSGYIDTGNSNRVRESNNNIRNGLEDFKKKISQHVDNSNQSAVQKSKHYLKALDKQLDKCYELDRMLDDLLGPN
jgi:hypothetical protein